MAVKVNFDAGSQASRDYQVGLGRAFWRMVRQRLGRGCNDLLSAGEILQYLKDQPRSEPVMMAVPTAQIVGSSGRSRDFDLAFYPRRKSDENRWINVATAIYQGSVLPPVLLLGLTQLGDISGGDGWAKPTHHPQRKILLRNF